MKRFAVLLSALVVCLVSAAQAQAPKPDPTLQKLKVLVGRWTYDGEYKPGSWGSGSKISGEFSARYILRGFAVEARSVEESAGHKVHYFEIDAYDPVNKNITFAAWSDAGTSFSGTVTVAGNTITWEGTVVAGGKQYRVREPVAFSEDSMSATVKAGISADGKTWAPFFEGTYTKIKPAAKK